MQYVAFDSHKRYTIASVENHDNPDNPKEFRINHEKGMICHFLKEHCEPGSPVAVETVGNWYWIVGEIEEAGFVPKLVQSRKAKLMMGQVNKTDKLDARGLNRLQRNGTLPCVWIPTPDIRDARELPRTRVQIVKQRTIMKNRIHANLNKFNVKTSMASPFAEKARPELLHHLDQLPTYVAHCTREMLATLDTLQAQIEKYDKMIKKLFAKTPKIQLLSTIPGIGFHFSLIISVEAGDINRFPSSEHFASYSGTTPRVHSSGGKTRYVGLRQDVNRFLKWAFIEGANATTVHRKLYPDRHTTKVYEKIRKRKGHGVGIGAVARHLAESAYWILKKKEPYRDPSLN